MEDIHIEGNTGPLARRPSFPFFPGGYKEMSSILADQKRLRIVYEPKCGGWGT